MPPIVEDQIFPSLLAFKQALHEWAIEKNFTPHILDSDKQRVRAGCRTAPDCPFRIRINYNAKRHEARVSTCEDRHSHSTGENVSQPIKRTVTGKMKFLVSVVPGLLKVGINTTTREICAAVFNRYGQAISQRQAQKVKRVLVKKPCRHCNQRGHSGKYCPNRPVYAEAGGAGGEHSTENEDTSGEEHPRRKSRCHICFQTGHNRKNCPNKQPANPEMPIVQDPSALLQNQLQQAAYAPAQPPNVEDDSNDTSPVNGGVNTTDVSTQPQATVGVSQTPTTQPPTSIAPTHFRPSMYPGIVPPMAYSIPQNMQQAMAAPGARTPEDPHMRAAELMRKAASLTQEAAKLNLEAARLIALAPS